MEICESAESTAEFRLSSAFIKNVFLRVEICKSAESTAEFWLSIAFFKKMLFWEWKFASLQKAPQNFDSAVLSSKNGFLRVEICLQHRWVLTLRCRKHHWDWFLARHSLYTTWTCWANSFLVHSQWLNCPQNGTPAPSCSQQIPAKINHHDV